jgi:hypothetical protein
MNHDLVAKLRLAQSTPMEEMQDDIVVQKVSPAK